MKEDEALVDILELCTKIDGKSAVIYHNFSRNTKDDNLKSEWEKMATEEREHVKCWQRLLTLVKEGDVSFIFDEPLKVKEELELILPKVETFLEQSRDTSDVSSTFFIACNLELFMLHRSFIRMFYFLQSISGCDHNFGEEYREHLAEFIKTLNRYKVSPEMKVLGGAIQRLWLDNSDLISQSNRDFLTGVLNRRGFFQIVTPLTHMAQREGTNVGVIMIDGDNFKKINDKYGHQAGDNVLKLIGCSIQNHVRHSDIVGRYGGEEFIVLLPDVHPEHLFEVAENIRKNIQNESKSIIPVTVSIGYAQKILNIDADKDVENLIKKADGCLYEAKNSGKNKVVGE